MAQPGRMRSLASMGRHSRVSDARPPATVMAMAETRATKSEGTPVDKPRVVKSRTTIKATATSAETEGTSAPADVAKAHRGASRRKRLRIRAWEHAVAWAVAVCGPDTYHVCAPMLSQSYVVYISHF